MRPNSAQPARTQHPANAHVSFRGRTGLFALGTAGIMLLFFIYYGHTWHRFTGAFHVCVQPFCDFVDYYYPMGEAIFRTGLPVKGFFYSPFIAILLATFHPLGLTASLILWGILQGSLVILYLLLFRRIVPAGLQIQLLFVALTVSSFPLLLNLMAGSVSVFTMVALLGLLALYERGRLAAGAGLLAFAVSFKFFPIIFFVPFAARRDTRFLVLVAVACGIFLLVVPGLLLGAGDTLGFYGALVNSFRESGWVTANEHSQYFPHLVLRLAEAVGHDAHAHRGLLYGIAYGVAAASVGLIFLLQRAGLRHVNLWSFQIVFVTIPFVLKTSWPHDFVFLPFTQALLVWRVLDGEKPATGTDAGERRSHARPWLRMRGAVTLFLILVSIVFSSVVFFDLFDDFTRYGFYGFIFWADLLLMIALYVQFLPAGLRRLRGTGEVYGGHAGTEGEGVQGGQVCERAAE